MYEPEPEYVQGTVADHTAWILLEKPWEKPPSELPPQMQEHGVALESGSSDLRHLSALQVPRNTQNPLLASC